MLTGPRLDPHPAERSSRDRAMSRSRAQSPGLARTHRALLAWRAGSWRITATGAVFLPGGWTIRAR